MSSCCPHAGAAARLFSRFARRHRRHYLRKGLQKSQRQMIEGLTRAGTSGAALLEIGCGVGYLHQSLLETGAGRALGIDLSDRMLEEARALARERGLGARTEYLQGDFVELAGTVQPADVVILDKVVCCYPDAETLIQRSLAKGRRVYALTYPRDRWFVRWGVGLTALALRLVRSPFRSYVHNPKRIEAWITDRGFRKDHEARTAIWLTQVYVRAAGARPA